MSIVYKLTPECWVEDPVTGKDEKVKYKAITPYAITCPQCSKESKNMELIKTKSFLIINCSICRVYTWLKLN